MAAYPDVGKLGIRRFPAAKSSVLGFGLAMLGVGPETRHRPSYSNLGLTTEAALRLYFITICCAPKGLFQHLGLVREHGRIPFMFPILKRVL